MRRAVLLREVGSDAPESIRLFGFGKNDTTKGTVVLDREGAEACLAAFAKYGNDLVVDYEHQTYSEAIGGPVPAAGWIRQGGLEVRDDGLWAKVEWTDEAKSRLSKREYRYFSPVAYLDAKRRVVELGPPGLVNHPATIAMEPLVAKRARDGRTVQLAAFEDIRASLDRALMERYRDGWAYILAVYDAEVVFESAGRTWRLGYRMDGSAAVLDEAQAQEVERTYSPVSSEASEVLAAKGTGMKTIFTALALSAAATEAEALSAVTRLQGVERELHDVAGTAVTAEALGRLRAWKAGAEEAVALRAKLDELQAKETARDAEAVLDKGAAEGRITPANREVWKKHATDAQGRIDVVKLKAMVDALPVVTNTNPHTPPASADTVVVLSKREIKLAKALKLTPEQYAEHKKTYAAAAAESDASDDEES